MELDATEKLLAMAIKSDAALNKRAGWAQNSVSGFLDVLLTHGRIEVGYRASCGKTDPTQFIYREWAKLLKAAEKYGLRITVEPVKHGNAYATTKGGFWNSAIYRMETLNRQGILDGCPVFMRQIHAIQNSHQ